MARRKKSSRRHHRGFGFFSKLLTVLSICAVVIVALTLFFKVDEILVSGNSHYTARQIQDACGVSRGDNLYLLNKQTIVQRLQKELPYIESVSINRSPPDRLAISVTECSATFAFVQDNTAWLVSPGGKIVESVHPASGASEIPQIDGAGLLAPSVGTHIALSSERDTQQKSLLALLSAAEEAGLTPEITGIHLEGAGELSMDYAGRFTVVMPYGADYPHLMKYLTAVVGQLETNVTGIIDLTREGEPHFRPG